MQHYYSLGKPLEEAARDLKIRKSALSKWVNNAKENEGTVMHHGSGNYRSDEEKEIARLKKELRDTQDALQILKKAIGILND